MDVSSPRQGSGAPGASRAPGAAGASAPKDRAPARSRAATRERIVASGTSLFAHRGLHDVTSHEIASDAGVAAGTFYLHFPDKQELFREIVYRAVAELQADLRKARDSSPDLASGARAAASCLLDFADRRRDLVRILFGRDSEARGLGADVLDRLAEGSRERILERQRDGATPTELDPDVAAQAIVGMWSRVIAWYAHDPSRADRQALLDTLIHFELWGLYHRPDEQG